MLSLVIPVYKNEPNLPRLLAELETLASRLPEPLEVVFVVDGSPDRSLAVLRERLPASPVRAQVLELSRNFGSFAAIAAGLHAAAGERLAVMAADLQEPPELMIAFQQVLARGEADIVLGYRTRRGDPWVSQMLSGLFWSVYRRLVLREMPSGGVDVFGCTRQVRDQLIALRETSSNLIALLLWLGFTRTFVPYERRPRLEGRSAWTFGRRWQYALDSIFNFTDLPIRALLVLGAAGVSLAIAAGATVLTGWLLGRIPVLGYTPVMLVIAFFGGLTALGLGIVGQYLWLSLQNARGRPNFVVRSTWSSRGAVREHVASPPGAAPPPQAADTRASS